MIENTNNILNQRLKADMEYYKRKLKEAIELLKENGVSENEIRRELDI